MKYEALKVFGNIKILAVIAGMFILSTIMALRTDTIMFEGFNTDVYKYYMEYLEGEFTQEKYNYVMEEYGRMKEHIANSDLYDEQYQNKMISATEYRELSSAASIAKGRIKTFEYIVDKTEYYAQCENTPSYFFDIAVEDYIVNMSVNIPLLLVLILIIATIFNEDYSANTVYMIRSSKDGKERLLCRRMLLVAVIAVLMSVIFYIGEFLVKYLYFDFGILDGNITSLMNVHLQNFEGTIFEYLFTTIGIRILYTVVVAIFISAVAVLSHKYMMTIGISIAIVYLPKVLVDSKWIPSAGLEAYTLLREGNSAQSNSYILVLVVYLVLSAMVVGGLIKSNSR